MENEAQKEKLDDLPPSDDNYWDRAEINMHNIKPIECRHYLEYEGNDAKCSHCGAGFYLDNEDKLVDGHLYRNEDLIL